MNRTDQLQNTLLGFNNTLSHLRAGSVKKTLDKCGRYRENGKVKQFSKKAFVIYYLEKGYLPIIKTETKYRKVTTGSFYNQSIREAVPYESKSYCLSAQKPNEDGATSSWEISKTEYDFAKYLLAVTSIDNLDAFIMQKIYEQKMAEEKARVEEQAQAAAQEQKEQANAEFKIWLSEQINTYNNELYLKILESVFIKYFGNVSKNSIGLLVLIENFDNPLCKGELINWLHNGNKASIKTFEYITGIKLEKSYKKRIIQLQQLTKADFATVPPQYIPRKTMDERIYKLAKQITRAGKIIAKDSMGKDYYIGGYKECDNIIVRSDSGYEAIYIGTIKNVPNGQGYMCLYTHDTPRRNSYPSTDKIAEL